MRRVVDPDQISLFVADESDVVVGLEKPKPSKRPTINVGDRVTVGNQVSPYFGLSFRVEGIRGSIIDCESDEGFQVSLMYGEIYPVTVKPITVAPKLSNDSIASEILTAKIGILEERELVLEGALRDLIGAIDRRDMVEAVRLVGSHRDLI